MFSGKKFECCSSSESVGGLNVNFSALAHSQGKKTRKSVKNKRSMVYSAKSTGGVGVAVGFDWSTVAGSAVDDAG